MNLLVITHNVIAKSPGGGVELYQEYLRELKNYDVWYLFPLTRGADRFLVLQAPNKKYFQYPVSTSIPHICFEDQERENILEKILHDQKIDIVHFQHLLFLPLSFPLVVKKKQIPSVYTLHDHFLICSRFNLIGSNGRFCNTYEEPVSHCDYCLHATNKLSFGTQKKRREFIQTVINSLSAIIANTSYLKEGLLKIFPDTSAEKIHIVEMLVPPAVKSQSAEVTKNTLQVAIPGNFTSLKGANLILDLMAGLKNINDISFTVMGRIQEASVEKKCTAQMFPNTTFLNGYEAQQTHKILSVHDVSLHLTICPESYMITLSEAWAAGVVPIVSNLGAPGERVENGKNGFTVSPYSIGKISDILLDLRKNSGQLNKLKAACKKTSTQNPKTHLKQLEHVFELCLN